MAVNIGPRIKVDGEKEYRESMAQIIQQTKTLDTEMKALTSGFTKNNDAVQTAQQKAKILTDQVNLQKAAISELSSQLSKSTKSLGDSDVKTQKYQQNLNKAQMELAQMEDNLRKVNTELRAEQSVAAATSSGWGKLKNQVAGLTSAQRAHKAQVAALKSDYAESRARVSALTQAVAQSANEHGDLSEETRELAQRLKDAQQETQQLGQELKEAGGKAGTFGDKISGLGGNLKGGALSGVKNLGNAIKGGFVGAAKAGVNAIAGFTKAAAGIGAAAGAGILAMGKVAYDYNSQMENYTANFETLLGSQEAATQKVADLKQMASKTPFEMGDLADATQQLLAMGVQSEDTGTYLQQLGDISLGNKDKLNSLVGAFGKMNSTGKVTLENINQMAEQGFNPLNEISKVTGESMTQLYDRVSKGAVSLDEIKLAMQNATTEGVGPFAGGMEKASQTMSGKISTIKDNAKALVGEVFTPITDGIKNNILPAAISGIDQLTAAFRTNGVSGMAAAAGDIIGKGLGQFAGALPKFVDTALNIVTSLADGIRNNQSQIADGVVKTISTLVTGLIRGLPQLLKTGGSLLLEIARGLAQQLPALGKEAVNMVKELVSSLWNNRGQILQAGVDIVQGIIDGIMSVWHSLVDWFNSLWDNLFGRRNVNVNVNATASGGRMVDGSHANGLWRVPFDNYVANLHRDEMVLPRRWANTLRTAGYMFLPQPAGGPAPEQRTNRTTNLGGVTFVIYQQPGEDAEALAHRVMDELETRVRQEEEGDLNGR